jgi:hypothetical protein
VCFESLPTLWTLRRSELYAGAAHHVRSIEHLVGDDAVLLIDPRLTAYGFAALLWVGGGNPSYYVADNDREGLNVLTRSLEGRRLYWIGDGNGPAPIADRVHFDPIALYQFVLSTPRLELRADPLAITASEVALAIYRVAADTPNEDASVARRVATEAPN